jgi:predicted O-methyltransferase YrrM
VSGGRALRSLAAAVRSPRRFAREAARLPLRQLAAARIAALPVIELAELTGGVQEAVVRLPPRDTRHVWSLGAAEQLNLQVLLRARGCSTAFEIGTFNGGTTRLLAETLPEDGRVWTIDLPPAAFDATQGPAYVTGADVGAAYRDSPAAHKITQLLGDTLTYDFAPFAQCADLVLVDAGHEYENGFADTRTALQLVRPGGLVLWDDFEPYWHGLVHGICDAMAGRCFGRLAGTSLAVYSAGEAGGEPLENTRRATT